jgi:hypothetical protein
LDSYTIILIFPEILNLTVTDFLPVNSGEDVLAPYQGRGFIDFPGIPVLDCTFRIIDGVPGQCPVIGAVCQME